VSFRRILGIPPRRNETRPSHAAGVRWEGGHRAPGRLLDDGATLQYDVDEDDPGETFLRSPRGGSHVGTAGYLLSPPGHGHVRFRFHVSTQVDGVSSVRLRFKPLLPPGIHHRGILERPSRSPYPEFSFEAGEGYGWTLFEAPDLGAQTPGSYTVDVYVDV
jgi:hypothetical protein